jgi:prepilin-type N-terminal cleavage/methylation domain-containing protein
MRRNLRTSFAPSRRPAQQGFTSSWRSAQQGFTLVEVLVALVVTSLILAIVMNGALQAKTRAVGAREKERAVMLARGLIAGRAAAPYDNATRTGEESGLRWTIAETRLATDPRGLLLLSEIQVTVRNANGATLSALQLRKLKAAPQS